MCVCMYTCIHISMYSCCVRLSCFSHIWLFATLWTAAYQTSLSMGFSRQEYWSELPWPPPGDLPLPKNQTCVSSSSCITDGFFTTGEAHIYVYLCIHVYIHRYTWEIWMHIHIKSGVGNGKPLSILAWKVPWTAEPGGLWSMGSQRVRHDWAHTCTHIHKERASQMALVVKNCLPMQET